MVFPSHRRFHLFDVLRELFRAAPRCIALHCIALHHGQHAVLHATYGNCLIFFADDRVNVTNELLTSMKTVKLNAWEQPMGDKVKGIRANEMKKLRNFSYYRVLHL